MRRPFVFVFLLTALVSACGGAKPPNGPTPTPRLSLTRFLAFGDSFTAGEVTNPTTFAPASPIGKLVLVPAASYPTVLEARLRVTYSSQAILISVTNAGVGSERILDGAQRFPSVYDGTRPEVVLIQEGANGLPLVLRLRRPDSASPAMTGNSSGMCRSAAPRAIQRAMGARPASSPG